MVWFQVCDTFWSHPKVMELPTVAGWLWVQGRPRKGDTLGYDGAHLQVRRLHGNANQHRCVDCGGQASEWSYRGGDPDELTTDPTVRREHPGLHYSADPDYYEPRCKPCHRRMDDSLIRGRDPQTGQWIA